MTARGQIVEAELGEASAHMYQAHFRLRQRPFRAFPDLHAYYPSTAHEAALEHLHQAVLDGEGLALLTGEPGSGKTLLLHRLLARLGPDVPTVLLTNSHWAGRADLLQAILFDLALPYQGQSEQELRLTLTDALLAQFQAGRPVLLVCDEAQHLSADLLEELRLLGNLEASAGKAIQVILAAQPAIEATLRRPELSALEQRLAVRPVLEALALDESADYLLHQLRAVTEFAERVFTEEALGLLAHGCGGLPRRLNQAAHLALTLACQGGTPRVDAEAAIEALSRLGLPTEPPEPDAIFADAEAAPPLREPAVRRLIYAPGHPA